MYVCRYMSVCMSWNFREICGLLGAFFDFSLFSLECCKLRHSSNFCDMFSVSVPKNFLVKHFLPKIAKKKNWLANFCHYVQSQTYLFFIFKALAAIYRRVKITKNMITRIITCCWIRSEDFYIPTSLMISQSSSLPTLQVEFKKIRWWSN